MDEYKQLLIELPGMEKNLKSWSSNSAAYNILPSLKSSIEKKDKESIIYCIDQIIVWYEENISKIKNATTYFTNKKEHERIFNKIKEIRENIEECEIFNSDYDDEKNNEPLILLSHRSSDKKYGDALEKFIIGLGVKNNQLIYTSHPLHKIPLDENIYDYLRKNLNRNIFMIILWSDEYLDSPACLNEMGAAWVVQCDYTNIYVPTFSFGNPKYHQCSVDIRKMGAVLNGDKHCKQAMLELKDKIQSLFELENDEAQIMYLVDTFIDEIRED